MISATEEAEHRKLYALDDNASGLPALEYEDDSDDDSDNDYLDSEDFQRVRERYLVDARHHAASITTDAQMHAAMSSSTLAPMTDGTPDASDIFGGFPDGLTDADIPMSENASIATDDEVAVRICTD